MLFEKLLRFFPIFMGVVFFPSWPNQSSIIYTLYSQKSPKTFDFRPFPPREIQEKLLFKFGNVKNILHIVLILKRKIAVCKSLVKALKKQEENTSSTEKSLKKKKNTVFSNNKIK